MLQLTTQLTTHVNSRDSKRQAQFISKPQPNLSPKATQQRTTSPLNAHLIKRLSNTHLSKRLCLLSLLGLATLLSACSTQPEWLQKKRNYPNWELSSRQVNQYSFHWEMTGDQAILPVQVFSTQHEVWLQFPEYATIPAIFEVDDRWDLVQGADGYTTQETGEIPLRYHHNRPYIVLKGNPSRLRLRLGHYEAIIWHTPR